MCVAAASDVCVCDCALVFCQKFHLVFGSGQTSCSISSSNAIEVGRFCTGFHEEVDVVVVVVVVVVDVGRQDSRLLILEIEALRHCCTATFAASGIEMRHSGFFSKISHRRREVKSNMDV